MAESIYSVEQIEQWGDNLKELKQQPRTDFNKKQAVEALMDIIEDTLEERSYREVAGGLQDWGLDISEGSLKKYVSTYRREHSADDDKESHQKPKKSASSRRKKSAQQKPLTKKQGAIASGQAPERQTADDNSITEEAGRKTQKFSGTGTNIARSSQSGQDRLKSDDSSQRYPDDSGKPLDARRQREAENAKKAGFVEMPEEL